jgi:hypothetical protein
MQEITTHDQLDSELQMWIPPSAGDPLHYGKPLHRHESGWTLVQCGNEAHIRNALRMGGERKRRGN